MTGIPDDLDDLRLPVPADRTKNQGQMAAGVKTSKFPRTSRREDRIAAVLDRRQPTLTVVLEDIHDPHNASAVLRACDAVGVLDVHLVYVLESPPRKSFYRTTSGSAAKWLGIHTFDSVESCYAHLKDAGFRIFATALRDDTHDLYSLDLTQPTALVFGNEHRGVSEPGVELADGTVGIPMNGMVESLNISVASAVSLYEAMRQRREAGMYAKPQLSPLDLAQQKVEWIRK
jgi:tRNA (guanosine-2'-O-)-methyltransferase